MNLTLILAVWGAVLSTLLGLLEILKFIKDRPGIKVTIKGGYKIYPKSTPYDDKTLIVIKAINIGGRPVTLVSASMLMPRGTWSKYLLCADPLTAVRVELTKGQSHDYIISEDDLESKYNISPKQHIAFVTDATGKSYSSHNILMRLVETTRIK